MKRTAIFLGLLLSTMLTHAADEKSLFITFNNGKQAEFKLSQEPEITFGNNEMTVKAANTKTTFTLWQVSTFTYGNATTGISKVENNGQLLLEGNHLIVDGIHNQIKAYSYDGRTISLSPIVTSNKTVINLESLSTGVYIIKVNGKSIKIARQ